MVIVIDQAKNISQEDKVVLFEEVRVRSAIWNINDKEHSNRYTVKAAWEEIAKAMSNDDKQFKGSKIFYCL